jgi:hypothetical protein
MPSQPRGASVLLRHQHVAVAAPGHQAVFDEASRPQPLDKEQPANEKQQDDHDTNQTRGLPLGNLFLRGGLKPMVMSIQSTLVLGCDLFSP